MTDLNLHLVSDATGETLEAVVKACVSQFEDVNPVRHFWPMIRSERQLDSVCDEIANKPGPVIFTLVNTVLRDRLQSRCFSLGLPTVSVLDPVLEALSQSLGKHARGLPGRQHAMDADYFRRIDAMHYSMAHDDGQNLDGLEGAQVVLVGVSRTSKTPTSIYLANRGYRTANYPLVPEVPVPHQILNLKKPLVVGLTASPERLVQIRRNRMLSFNQMAETAYVDQDIVTDEVKAARRLFADRNWPVIDVTRRSIEETAAAVINLLNQRQSPAVADGAS